MESECFDGSQVDQGSLKPDTTIEIDELISNSSTDDTPPTMIIVETCVSPMEPNQTPLQSDIKDKVAAMSEGAEQAGCSILLGLKPNVQFQKFTQNRANSQQPLANTEAGLAAVNISADAVAKLNKSEPAFTKLRRCVDGATQCNNLNFDYEMSNSSDSTPSIGSLVCRICHNADNPEQLVSPCLCKGSLTYVHVHCLERWISTSRCTICELCQFQYNTEQTLRYTCLQSLRLWYSRAMSRRALQEDCQMFSLLTLVAFGIIGTLLVGIQYYALNTQSWGLSKLWTKSWMLFFLFMTVTVYFANVYMLIKSQLTPWYRWWQSARDIKLILENRRPFPNPSRLRAMAQDTASTTGSMFTHHDHTDVPTVMPQPQFLTPASSSSSLSANLPKQPMSEIKLEPQKLAAADGIEKAIELALMGHSPTSQTLTNDEVAVSDDATLTVNAGSDAKESVADADVAEQCKEHSANCHKDNGNGNGNGSGIK